MIEIIPSLLVDSREEFEKRLRLVEQDVKTVHVDILDGTLFPFTNWHDARAVGAMATPVRYELHLMVTNPLPIIEEWKREVPNVVRALIHAEIERPLGTVLETIRQVHRLEDGLAINPETPLEEIHHLLHELKALLIMGVKPGQSGQPFGGEYLLEKIRQAHAHAPHLPIEVDGGVTLELAPTLAQSGATRLCAASAIFSAPNQREALQRLKSAG